MRKVRGGQYSLVLISMLTLLLFGGQHRAMGEVIGASNWEKAKDLLPREFIGFVKNGDFALNWVTEVNFCTNRENGFWPEHTIRGFKENEDRYDVDERNLLVDVRTGRLPTEVLGTPFPQINPADPKAGIKIMYCKDYMLHQLGNKYNSSIIRWISRSGFEREIESIYQETAYVGWPGAEKIPNPKGAERRNILSVRKPYDVAGTSVMLWRFLDERRDLNFSYVPAIRRVRRTSPAARSDAFVGSDFSMDDVVGYAGKVADFKWKLLRQQTALMPWHDPTPMKVERQENGEWRVLDTEIKPIKYGYHEENWTGAPWCPVSAVYLKRPVWVVEANAKDPYYNYGTQYLWIDKETNIPFFKIVYDRGGKLWKVVMVILASYKSEDASIRFVGSSDHVVIDVIRDHATLTTLLNPGREMTYFKKLDGNDYTLGGFTKYCK